MARRRALSADPMIRSAVRTAVRVGLGDPTILADVLARFPRATAGLIQRMITQERGRQKAVDSVMARDFRRRTNLHAIVGCGAGEHVRGAITIQWFDESLGRIRRYGASVTFGSTGVLGSLINKALGQVISAAIGSGYDAPLIRSSMRSGTTSYRIDYLDCY